MEEFALASTKAGQLDTSIAISEIDDYQNGYYAAMFTPSKKLLEKLKQKTVLLSGTIQNSNYTDFGVTNTAPTPGTASCLH